MLGVEFSVLYRETPYMKQNGKSVYGVWRDSLQRGTNGRDADSGFNRYKPINHPSIICLLRRLSNFANAVYIINVALKLVRFSYDGFGSTYSVHGTFADPRITFS